MYTFRIIEKLFFMVFFFATMYTIINRLIPIDEKHCNEVYINFLNKKVQLNKYEQELLENTMYPEDNYTDNIIGYSKIKDKLNSIIIKPLLNRSEILPNGIIFQGEPGTGKTLFAKYILNKAKVSFINFDISSIENKYYGESSKYMKAVFTLAKKLEPCIIFIDELDGVCGERTSIDQFQVNSMKTQMLKYMDGISKGNKIILIGATNKLNFIDNAILRRMKTTIKFDLPSKEEIKAMIEFYITDIELCESVIKDYQLCVGYSGSDIYEICKLVMLKKESNEDFSLQSVLYDIGNS